MSDNELQKLREQVERLRMDIESERRWNEIPEALKPTSKSRWDQINQNNQNNISRGWSPS